MSDRVPPHLIDILEIARPWGLMLTVDRYDHMDNVSCEDIKLFLNLFKDKLSEIHKWLLEEENNKHTKGGDYYILSWALQGYHEALFYYIKRCNG